MFVLKAFATNDAFIDNAPGAFSNIGELSTQALTFSRKKGMYKSTVSADIDLTTFTSDLNNNPYQVPQYIVDDIITIVKYVYNAATVGNTILYPDLLLSSLLLNFAATANNFTCGAVVTNGTHNIVEWVGWTSLNTTDIGSDNQFKVWFSDSSFQIQYDDYEIVIVPPISPIDNFFGATTSIIASLASITPSVSIGQIQTAKNGNPETILTAKEFNFVDPTTPGNLIPTTWYFLIYGAAGNNVDVLQNSLIEYILNNSAKTQVPWTVIFPTIFKTTEFILIPNWNKYSIPNKTLQAGIYSPAVIMSEALNLLVEKIPNYTPPHILSNADALSQPYKSLTLMSIGNPNNTNNIYNVTTMFPDFIDVPSTSIDFARMSQLTQDWANMLAVMLVTAETMTNYSTIPLGMSKVTRNGILYLVSKFQNIDYLVASKHSF